MQEEHIDFSPPTGGQWASGLSQFLPHIEALLFASEKPLSSAEITELMNSAFGFMEDKMKMQQTDTAIEGIIEKYSSEFYPFEVVQSGGGWQFLTKKEFHKTVAQLNGEKFLKRLSTAALETLAIIAYKQPITKGEIESIRGVNSDYSVQKILEKELIVISGRNENMPGHPLVYETSRSFMDYFGINSSNDLPKIREVLAAHMAEPTAVENTGVNHDLVITEAGELTLPGEEKAEPLIKEPAANKISNDSDQESDDADSAASNSLNAGEELSPL